MHYSLQITKIDQLEGLQKVISSNSRTEPNSMQNTKNIGDLLCCNSPNILLVIVMHQALSNVINAVK